MERTQKKPMSGNNPSLEIAENMTVAKKRKYKPRQMIEQFMLKLNLLKQNLQ